MHAFGRGAPLGTATFARLVAEYLS